MGTVTLRFRFLWAFTLTAALSGAASAVPVAYDQVLNAISVAQRRVLLYTPALTDPGLTGALREAVLDTARETPVYVLTVPFFSYKLDSGVNALTLVGALVHEAQVDSRLAVLIVDHHVFVSKTLGRVPRPTDIEYLPGKVNTYLNWYKAALGSARRVSRLDAVQRIKEMAK